MFSKTNNLFVLRELKTSGNVPSEIKTGLINPLTFKQIEYRFETVEAIRVSLPVLSKIIDDSNKGLSKEQLDWYKSFAQKISEITSLYRSIGDDYLKNASANTMEQLKRIHTLNENIQKDCKAFISPKNGT